MKIQKDWKFDEALEYLVQNDFISEEKVKVIKHKARRKTLIGAKMNGKTFIAMLDVVLNMICDPYFNGAGYRKYKTNSTHAMRKYFLMIVKELNLYGFDTPNFASNQKEIRQELSKSDMTKNNIFTFGSLEDISGSFDGSGMENLGYFGSIVIDEPILRKDMYSDYGITDEKRKEVMENWVGDLETIWSNHLRFNESFNQRKENIPNFAKKSVEKHTTWMLLNPWNENAPIVRECEEILPESEFMEFIFNGIEIRDIIGNERLVNEVWDEIETSLLDNFLLYTYDEASDHLVLRCTSFMLPKNRLNPKKDILLEKIKKALVRGSFNALTYLLGLNSKSSEANDMLVYGGINSYNEITFEKLINEGWKIDRICYSADVDFSRIIVLTPTLLMSRIKDKETLEYIGYIAPQYSFKCNGSGSYGEKNDGYCDLLNVLIDKDMTKRINNFRDEKNAFKASFFVDDKSRYILNYFHRNKSVYISQYSTFKQLGKDDIIHRQDKTMTLLDAKRLFIDEKNVMLISTMKTCLKKHPDNPKRDTTSIQILDYIDSMEQGILRFYNILSKGLTKNNLKLSNVLINDKYEVEYA